MSYGVIPLQPPLPWGVAVVPRAAGELLEVGVSPPPFLRCGQP